MPLVRFRLKCRRPKVYSENPRTLGEHIKKRRLELGLTQEQAAKLLGVNSWMVVNWETGRNPQPIRSMPAILRFLSYDPFPAPTTLPERLLHERRKHGWSIREAALHLGVDPTTWSRWERGELILFKRHRNNVAQLLGVDQQELTGEMQARWNGKHRKWESADPPCSVAPIDQSTSQSRAAVK